MVKGVSKQVIVVNSPDKALFDQAIFILSDEALSRAVTDEKLLREAKRLVNTPTGQGKRFDWFTGLMCAVFGAMLMGGIWLLATIL